MIENMMSIMTLRRRAAIRTMIRRLGVLCVLSALMVPMSALGQTSANECVELVRQVYAAFPSVPAPDRVIHMNYTVRTTFRDSARAKPSVATIDLLMSSARMQLRSNEVEIYRDSASAFMIVPSIRTIYRSDAGLHNLSMGDPMQLMAMRDTLLALSERTECREVVGPGGIEQARVMLHLNPRGVARFRCSSLEFLLERATPSLRGIRVIYAGRSEIASVEMTFNEIDYNYQTSELDRPIASLVMSTDGQLNERYRGYRLIDTRTEESAK